MHTCIHMCIVDVRLTSANLALLVLGVIPLCVAIALCVVLVLVKIIYHKGIIMHNNYFGCTYVQGFIVREVALG